MEGAFVRQGVSAPILCSFEQEDMKSNEDDDMLARAEDGTLSALSSIFPYGLLDGLRPHRGTICSPLPPGLLEYLL